jgi:hypothetical protein
VLQAMKRARPTLKIIRMTASRRTSSSTKRTKPPRSLSSRSHSIWSASLVGRGARLEIGPCWRLVNTRVQRDSAHEFASARVRAGPFGTRGAQGYRGRRDMTRVYRDSKPSTRPIEIAPKRRPSGVQPKDRRLELPRRSPGPHRRLQLFAAVVGRAQASGPTLRSGGNSRHTLVVRTVPGRPERRKGIGENGCSVDWAFVPSIPGIALTEASCART